MLLRHYVETLSRRSFQAASVQPQLIDKVIDKSYCLLLQQKDTSMALCSFNIQRSTLLFLQNAQHLHVFFLVVETDLQCQAWELNLSSPMHPPFGNGGTHVCLKSLNVSQSNSHVCFTQKCCYSLGSSVYRSHSVWQTQGFHSIAGSLSNPSNDKKHTGSL